jgi:hypothetical protein
MIPNNGCDFPEIKNIFVLYYASLANDELRGHCEPFTTRAYTIQAQ